MQRRQQAGFTLIELMIAVVILGIIAAIAVPIYRGYVAEARIGTAIKDIRQIELIIDDRAMDNDLVSLEGNPTPPMPRGLYLNDGIILLGDPSTTPAGTIPYLDPWDNRYRYRRPGTLLDGGGATSNNSINPQGYDLWSAGPDGTHGNGDDVVRGCDGEFTGYAADQPSC